MFLSIPGMALRWLYMVMAFLLQLTQLSSQLSFVNKNIYNQKFPNQLYFQRKSQNVWYIQSCYIANTFRLSSGRHMHAWRAYFLVCEAGPAGFSTVYLAESLHAIGPISTAGADSPPPQLLSTKN